MEALKVTNVRADLSIWMYYISFCVDLLKS